MATKTYTTFSDSSNGNSEFGFAGAYISNTGSNTYYAYDTVNWHDKRRWIGSDYNGYGYCYCYCAFAQLPVGNNLKISLTFTANNGYWYGSGNSEKTMLVGYSLSAPASGAERNSGKVNSPSGLTVSRFYLPAKSGTYQNTAASIELSLPDNYSGKKVYFYFWGKDVTTQYSAFSFKSLAGSVSYTSYTTVGSSYISTVTPQVMGKNSSCTLKISPASGGTNNPVKNYRVYYGTSKPTTASSYVTKTASSNNTITISYSDIGSPAAGTKIYFGLKAMGTVSGYDGSFSAYDSDYVIINSPPTKPTVALSSNTVPKNGAIEYITITSLSATDLDGDELSYYYCCSNKSTAPTSGWQSISVNGTIGCTNDKPYVHFKAWDGYQYGDSVYKLLIENAGPTSVSISSVSGDNYYGQAGACYTRKISVFAQGSSSYTYDWKYRYGPNGTWNSLGQGQNLENIGLPSGQGQIYVKFTATDNLGDTYETDPYNTYLRYAKDFTDNEINVVRYQLTNLQNSTKVGADYTSRALSAKVSFSAMTEHDPSISLIIASMERTDGHLYDFINWADSFNAEGSAQEKSRNFVFSEWGTQKLNSCNLVFHFFTENSSGQTLELYRKTFAVKMLPLLDFIFPDTMTDAQKQINLDLVHLTSGEEAFYVRYLEEAQIEKYEIVAVFDDDTSKAQYYLDNYATFELYNTDTAILKFETKNLYSLFQSLKLKSDKNYTGIACIHAVNVLGEVLRSSTTVASNSAVLTIKTTEPPRFKPISNNVKPLMHQYTSQTAAGAQGNVFTPDWTQSIIKKRERMFNPGEYVYFDTQFALEQPMKVYFDGSGNAPTERASRYTYSIFYTIANNSTGPTKDSGWVLVPGLTGLTSLGAFCIPSTFQPESGEDKIYFCVEVTDELGLVAINEYDGNAPYVYVSDPKQYLLWCRRQIPTIRIAKCTKEDDYYKVQFEVEDFGGNNNGYSNFARSPDANGIQPGDEGAMKITWKCGTSISSMTSSNDLPINGRISELSHLEDGKSKEFGFGTMNGLTGRIYVKAHITFYTNTEGAKLECDTQTYAVYTEVPTVAYRSHNLGVNVKPDDAAFSDDVLTISDFENKRYVRLVGMDDSTSAREIIIDLKTGLVSGLIIDGGTW